jgi:hypothetical protein
MHSRPSRFFVMGLPEVGGGLYFFPQRSPRQIPCSGNGREQQADFSASPTTGNEIVDGNPQGHEGDDGPKALSNEVDAFGHGVLFCVVSIKKMPVGCRIR